MPERKRSLKNIIVLASVREHEIDGIHDYTCQLAAILQARDDVHVSYRNPRQEPTDRFTDLMPQDDGGTLTVLLQYNPFTFARWGFAPWLPFKLWRLRRFSPRLKIGLVVHEMYVPIKDWRSALMGAWQRLQFFAVRALSDVVFTTITAWASELQARHPRRPVHHLPVASNLPDMRHTRAAERERLGADDDTVVLAAFGTNNPLRLMDYVASATTEVARSSRTILLNLGYNAPPIDAGPTVRVVTPGPIEGAEIARYLAASDIYLAPMLDGISTRRTTFMAALQHGLPVVSIDGPSTDSLLREADMAVRLTSVEDREGFVRETTELATHPLDRSRRGALARSLYEREFDWPVVSARLVATILGDGRSDCR